MRQCCRLGLVFLPPNAASWLPDSSVPDVALKLACHAQLHLPSLQPCRQQCSIVVYQHTRPPELQTLHPPTPQHLCYCGEKLKGRYTLAKHWHGLMRQVAALGDIVLQVDKVDQQPLAGAVSVSPAGGVGRAHAWHEGPPGRHMRCTLTWEGQETEQHVDRRCVRWVYRMRTVAGTAGGWLAWH